MATYADYYSRDPSQADEIMKYQPDVDEAGRPMASSTITPMGQATISRTTGREVGGEYTISGLLQQQKKLQDAYDARNAAWNLVAQHGYDFNEAKRITESQIAARDELAKSSIEESLADAEEARKQAGYSRQLSKYRTELAQIDKTNLADAGDEIQNLEVKYAHLAGALDPNIARQFENLTRMHQAQYDNYMAKIQKRLPQGIPVEAVLDKNGRPSLEKINEARAGILQIRAAGEGEKAGAVAAARMPYQQQLIGAREAAAEKLTGVKTEERIREKYATIPAQEELIKFASDQGLIRQSELANIRMLQIRAQKGNKAAKEELMMKLQQIEQATPRTQSVVPPSISPTGKVFPAGSVGGTAFYPSSPAGLPELKQPSVEEPENPSPSPAPSATTGLQPTEGMRVRQKGQTYEYRGGEYVPVQ